MNKKFYITFFALFCLFFCNISANAVDDFFIEEILKYQQTEKPVTNTEYNYNATESVPVKLQLNGKISTKNNHGYEGQILKLRVKQNVKYNGKIIVKSGAQATAKLETIMTKGMNGIPAILIVDNFQIDGIDSDKLKGTYIKKGLNLSWLVFPIKWALTILPPTGSLTNFIMGGNATIDSKDTITLRYYPNWN